MKNSAAAKEMRTRNVLKENSYGIGCVNYEKILIT